jgi:rRNA maturation endonuclease Nob1
MSDGLYERMEQRYGIKRKTFREELYSFKPIHAIAANNEICPMCGHKLKMDKDSEHEQETQQEASH